jgi:hypothetical protein
MSLQYQLVDLRDEIAAYECEHRKWPRPTSTSKSRRSMEPENNYFHAKFAEVGAGRPIMFIVTTR